MFKSFKTFLVCVFGGCLGTLVILELNTCFWWSGFLLGGASGYFFYNFEKITRVASLSLIKYNGQEKNRFFWELMYFSLSMVHLIIACGVPLLLLYRILPQEIFTGEKQGGINFVVSVITIPTSISGLFSVFYTQYKILEKKDRGEKVSIGNSILLPVENVRQAKDFLLKANPIFFLLYWYPKSISVLIGSIIKLIYRIARKVPAGFNFLKKRVPVFLENTISFIGTICSDRRFLCIFSAFIGASLGYLFGNAIGGVLIGGILGLFVYEFISKRRPSNL